MTSKTTIRAPQQSRSQQRVDQILLATKQLIEQHGCASLKMSDIAKTANISIGSIYQYYPDKQTIVAALAQHYFDINHEGIKQAMEVPPQNLADVCQLMSNLIEGYYELYRTDPVLHDIFLGSSTDKQFKEIDTADTERNIEIIYKGCRHLVKSSRRPSLKLLILVQVNMVASMVYTATQLDEDKGKKVIMMGTKMINAGWKDIIEN